MRQPYTYLSVSVCGQLVQHNGQPGLVIAIRPDSLDSLWGVSNLIAIKLISPVAAKKCPDYKMHIQDSIIFYDCIYTIMYMVNVYMIIFIIIFMIIFGPLACVTGRVFNVCVLYVMNVIIWIGQLTIYQQQH